MISTIDTLDNDLSQDVGSVDSSGKTLFSTSTVRARKGIWLKNNGSATIYGIFRRPGASFAAPTSSTARFSLSGGDWIYLPYGSGLAVDVAAASGTVAYAANEVG